MIVTLIGYRGSGKTSVGKILAQALGIECVDADVEIEREACKSISEIFAHDGEQVFRDLEESVIQRILDAGDVVLAAGGGAVLRETTRQRMRSAGPVVWLKASPKELFRRIVGDDTTGDRRPDLTDLGGYEEVEELLAARTPIYRQSCTLEVETGENTPEHIADEIARALSEEMP